MTFSYFKRFALALVLVVLGAVSIPAYSYAKAIWSAIQHGELTYEWLASEASQDAKVNRAKVLEDLIQAELARRNAPPAKK